MKKLEEELWKFVRDDFPTEQFEQWVYGSSELETCLGLDLYLELISLNFQDRKAVWELRSKLETWLDKHIPRECDCVTWRNNQSINLGYDTVGLLDNFETLCKRTPWLSLVYCPKCGTYWYVAIDTIGDDYFLYRLDNVDAMKIIKEDIWPVLFDDNQRFWPNSEWLE